MSRQERKTRREIRAQQTSDLLEAARTYLRNMPDDWNYVLPTDLRKMQLENQVPFFLLDIRKSEDYVKGHIENTTNIYWLDLLENENLSKLPKDQTILVICYLGHTASQIMTLLNLIGFKAKALKFGMGIPPSKGVEIAGWLQLNYPVEVSK